MKKILLYILLLTILVSSAYSATVSHSAEHIKPGILGQDYLGNWAFMNGYLGVNTVNPMYKLDVNGNVSLNNTLFVTEGGNVGIGTASPLRDFSIHNEVVTPGPLIQLTTKYNNSGVEGSWRGGPGIDLLSLNTSVVGDISYISLRAYDNTGSANQYGAFIKGYVTETGNIPKTGIKFQTNDASDIYSDDSMIITPEGNVGIGTSNPTEKLHIENGSLLIRSNAAGNNGLIYFYNTSNNESGQIYGYKSDLKLYSDGNILLTNIGNVGIGTTNPAAKLDIVDNSATNSGIHLGYSINSGMYIDAIEENEGVIAFGTEPSYSSAEIKNWTAKATSASAIWSDNGAMAIYSDTGLTIGNNFTPTPRIYLDTDGNVGIGTTSPQAKLDVNGNQRISYSQSHYTTFTSGSTGDFAIGITGDEISMFSSSTFPSYLNLGYNSLLKTNIRMYNGTTNKINIVSEGNTYFNGGNVGIGTTVPEGKFEIIKDADLSSSIFLSDSALVIRSDNDGNDATLRFGTDNTNLKAIIQTQQTTTGSTFDLAINPFGGNVGIGTTTPSGPLEVYGNNSGSPVNTIALFRGASGVSTGTGIVIGAMAGNPIISSVLHGYPLLFGTTTGPTINEKMRITNDGHLGIGTTIPVSKLAVVGLPSGATDSVASGNLAGAVCITDTGNMYIDTDGSCGN